MCSVIEQWEPIDHDLNTDEYLTDFNEESRSSGAGLDILDQLELMHFIAEDGEFSYFLPQRPEPSPPPYNGFFFDEPSWVEEKESEASTGIEASDGTTSCLADSNILDAEELDDSPPRNSRLERARRQPDFSKCVAANSKALCAYTAIFLFGSDAELRAAAEDPPLGAAEFAWLVGFLRARTFKRSRQRQAVTKLLEGDQETLRANAHLLRHQLCHQRPVHTLRSLFPHLLRFIYGAKAPRIPQTVLSAGFCAEFIRRRNLGEQVRSAAHSPAFRAAVLDRSRTLFLRKFSLMAYKTVRAGGFSTARFGLVAKEFEDGIAMLLRIAGPASIP